MNTLNFEDDSCGYIIRYIIDKDGKSWFSAQDTAHSCGYGRALDVYKIRNCSQKKLLGEILGEISNNEHPSSMYMSIWDVQRVLKHFDSPVTRYFVNEIERLCEEAFLAQQSVEVHQRQLSEATVQISSLQQSIEVHQRQLSEATVQITNLQQSVEARDRQISEQLAVIAVADRILAEYRQIVNERCISHLQDTTKANKIVILRKNVETRYPYYCIRGQGSYVNYRLAILRRVVYPNMEVIVNVHKPAGVNFYNFLKERRVVEQSGNDLALAVPQNVFVAIVEGMEQIEVEVLVQRRLEAAQGPQ